MYTPTKRMMKMRPVRGFLAELATSWGVAMSCARLWRSPSPWFRDTVLMGSPMRDSTYATLFTYMYRRFGIPPLPGDDYKDLCGGWILTTPSPDLVVLVRPSMTGPEFSFTPMYVRGTEQPRLRDVEDLKLSAAEVENLKTAYMTLLKDLLRPVGVRDSYMNALGEVDDDSPLRRCDKDGESVYEADRHSSAGIGVPAGLVGCDAWAPLCSLIWQAGEADMVKGSAEVVAQLRAPVFAEAALESLSIKRLILMGVDGEARLQIGGMLGLSEDTLPRVIDDFKLFHGRSGQDGNDSERTRALNTILDETPDEVAAKAYTYLTRLAYETEGVSRVFSGAVMNRTMNEAWTDLSESVEGDYPEETLPIESRDTGNLQQILRSNFEAGGHLGLVAWLERTLARRHGADVLSWIVMHLRHQMSKSPAAQP